MTPRLAYARLSAPAPGTLWWIVAASVVLRVASALYFGNHVYEMPGVADQFSYHTLAGRVKDGFGFSFAEGWWPATRAGEPTAHWSYLFVGYLAGLYTLVGTYPIVPRLVQAVIVGILQPYLTWRVTRRSFGPGPALLAAGLVSVYLYFVYYAGALMTESFYLVAILWGVDLATQIAHEQEDERRRRLGPWTWLGLAFAIAVLLRQAFLFMLPVIMVWIAAQIWRRVPEGPGRGRRVLGDFVPGAAVTTLIVVCAIAPWTVRNYRAFGRFVPLNTNAGFAFYWGNHPVHGRDFLPLLPKDGPAYQDLIPAPLRQLNEAELDQTLLVRGVGFVVADPVRFAHLCVGRVVEYFKFWPTAESGMVSNVSRVLSFGVFLPFFCAGLLLTPWRASGSAWQRSSGPGLLVLIAATYTLLHVLTWTLVRYRLPVDALLMPFGGLALSALLEWTREARWSSRAHSHSVS